MCSILRYYFDHVIVTPRHSPREPLGTTLLLRGRVSRGRLARGRRGRRRLGQRHDAARRSVAGVASLQRLLVTAAAQVVLLLVHDDGSSQDALRPGQRDDVV